MFLSIQDTVYKLMENCKDQFGFPKVEGIQLIYQGQMISMPAKKPKEKTVIGDYNVQKNHTITLLFKSVGGWC